MALGQSAIDLSSGDTFENEKGAFNSHKPTVPGQPGHMVTLFVGHVV